MIAPVGPQAPSHARRYARLVAVASRRARVPPVDYRDDRPSLDRDQSGWAQSATRTGSPLLWTSGTTETSYHQTNGEHCGEATTSIKRNITR